MTARGGAGDAEVSATILPLGQRTQGTNKLLPIINRVDVREGKRKEAALDFAFHRLQVALFLK